MIEHCIVLINDPITVATVFRFIELGKGEKSVGMVAFGLWSKVAKQLLTAVDYPIAITIERQKRIVKARLGP